MAERSNNWTVAQLLRPDELGSVLDSFGSTPETHNRLQAVIALVTGAAEEQGLARGGAFATGPANVTVPFTSGLHNCLRGVSVNDDHGPATNHRC